GGKNSLNRLIRCVCGKKIGPDPRNFNQRVSLGRNDLLIRTFPSFFIMPPFFADDENKAWLMLAIFTKSIVLISSNIRMSLSLRSWRNETRGKY
ncbi:hypothetical protein N8D60_15210, partial [Klebsiella pneumoniae]|nr:hypothetical protein [Klebsiella pneumoniae]MCX3406093.1 hypothetical protein [Klebsiella pneumoniae]